jgi:hypothetical protein
LGRFFFSRFRRLSTILACILISVSHPLRTFAFMSSYRSFSSRAAFLSFDNTFFSYSSVRYGKSYNFCSFPLFIELSFQCFCRIDLFRFGDTFGEGSPERWILVWGGLSFPLFSYCQYWLSIAAYLTSVCRVLAVGYEPLGRTSVPGLSYLQVVSFL